jgi:hypothetical protein
MQDSKRCMIDTGGAEDGAGIQSLDLPGLQAEHLHAKI